MERFVELKKMSKKAQKEFHAQKRETWGFSPITRKVESKKHYSRKRKPHDRYDECGMGLSRFPLLPG